MLTLCCAVSRNPDAGRVVTPEESAACAAVYATMAADASSAIEGHVQRCKGNLPPTPLPAGRVFSPRYYHVAHRT
jgi:hypothetical protein